MLFLAVAVFAWGLHSKLSLYHVAGSHSAANAQAKLLSQKERPVKAIAAAAECPMSHPSRLSNVPPAWDLVARAAAMPGFWSKRVIETFTFRYQGTSSLCFFFFRPPPIRL